MDPFILNSSRMLNFSFHVRSRKDEKNFIMPALFSIVCLAIWQVGTKLNYCLLVCILFNWGTICTVRTQCFPPNLMGLATKEITFFLHTYGLSNPEPDVLFPSLEVKVSGLMQY
jgi:hypothetical protein